MSKFQNGDRVIVTNPQYQSWAAGKEGIVTNARYDCLAGGIAVEVNLEGVRGRLFYEEDLELVPEIVEAEVEAQPVHYRICVGTVMGTTEYPSLEAAQDSAKLHGNHEEQFSIFEVVKIADYRVKVTKELETI